jgi:hypothetical protein
MYAEFIFGKNHSKDYRVFDPSWITDSVLKKQLLKFDAYYVANNPKSLFLSLEKIPFKEFSSEHELLITDFTPKKNGFEAVRIINK